MARQTFLAGIAREGTTGSVRGKIPAGLIKAINADEGQGLEFTVAGTSLVGVKLLSAKEFRMAQRDRIVETPKKAAPKKVVGKSTAKRPAPVARKVTKPAPKAVAKPVKRKTVVEYEEPVRKRPAGKISLKKLSLKGRR